MARASKHNIGVDNTYEKMLKARGLKKPSTSYDYSKYRLPESYKSKKFNAMEKKDV